MPIALDATYSAGSRLTGVGVYCREMLHGLAAAHPEQPFRWYYRPHRLLRSFDETLPHGCRRRVLFDWLPTGAELFHGLNQRLPRWRSRRNVVTFHDLFVMTGEYSSPEFRARFTEQARHAAANADTIITVSHFTARQVHELLNVSWDRLRVVHHGVRPPKEDLAAPRKPVVLHVGAIQARKNIARLIQAFRALPQEWSLVLAGSIGYEGEKALAGADERVKVTGYVNDAELQQLYRTSSIFAFPSLDEGFGIPTLEAMANGLPVIASNAAALPEVCGDAAILVDPRNTEELSERLLKVATDLSVRQEIIRRGLIRASQFTWEKAARETWQVYSELD